MHKYLASSTSSLVSRGRTVRLSRDKEEKRKAVMLSKALQHARRSDFDRAAAHFEGLLAAYPSLAKGWVSYAQVRSLGAGTALHLVLSARASRESGAGFDKRQRSAIQTQPSPSVHFEI